MTVLKMDEKGHLINPFEVAGSFQLTATGRSIVVTFTPEYSLLPEKLFIPVSELLTVLRPLFPDALREAEKKSFKKTGAVYFLKEQETT